MIIYIILASAAMATSTSASRSGVGACNMLHRFHAVDVHSALPGHWRSWQPLPNIQYQARIAPSWKLQVAVGTRWSCPAIPGGSESIVTLASKVNDGDPILTRTMLGSYKNADLMGQFCHIAHIVPPFHHLFWVF